MTKVSVNLTRPSPYIEKEGRLYRLKRKLTYAFAFRLIKKFTNIRSAPSILEIGTGSGFFLSFCKDAFKDPELYGIEYDDRLLEVTRQRAPYAKCIQGNAETFEFQNISFDIIASFQVIEHLYDPLAMFTRAHKYLKPGGLFIVTSPNIDGYGARFMGERWHGYRHDHVTLKGVNEWTRLISENGFQTLYSGSTFLSGIPFLNKFPLGVFNWTLLVVFGCLRWNVGEAYVGVFRRV